MKIWTLFLFTFLLLSCETSTVISEAEAEQQAQEEEDSVASNPACNKSTNLSNIQKPTGVYTSVLTSGAVTNQTIQGGLIRITWAELEPQPGIYDFSSIEEKLALLPSGKSWSLAVHGGYLGVDESDPDLYDGSTYPNGQPRPTVSMQLSPSWLKNSYNVETFEMAFRSVTVYMPKYWDTNLQERLALMLDAVALEYKNDSRLKLVYVPQMTSNGVEGHFNGVSNSILIEAAGINTSDTDAESQFETIWVNASLQAAKATAQAFDNKAIAYEVHEILDRTNAPQTIINAFLSDSDFENRVGAAMWWISGGTTYQPELVEILKNYSGDLYGQVIGNSSQTYRFPNDDYTQVFTQAKELCMRYIEPWNYEFENNTFNSTMTDFNNFASNSFE